MPDTAYLSVSATTYTYIIPFSASQDQTIEAQAKMGDNNAQTLPEGITSLLDTDLYKLTMQCAVLKYFPTSGMFPRPWVLVSYVYWARSANPICEIEVTYSFTNRTKDMKFTRRGYKWLVEQINSTSCSYTYLHEIPQLMYLRHRTRKHQYNLRRSGLPQRALFLP